jgi:hypothetical protein
MSFKIWQDYAMRRFLADFDLDANSIAHTVQIWPFCSSISIQAGA